MRRVPAHVHRHWRSAVPLAMVGLTGAWFAGREPAPASTAAALPLSGPAALIVRAAQAEEAPSAGAAVVDIFPVRTWEPPPPPPTPEAAAAPQPPQPPPLPFRYFGRIAEPGKPEIFLLLEGDRIHRVRVGDAIGRTYRVDKFDRGRLLFRYRPMNVTQALAVDSPT